MILIDCVERDGVFVPRAIGRWRACDLLRIFPDGSRQYQAAGWQWAPFKEERHAHPGTR